ncbi:CHAT domain-containing protein [Lactifluus subvellereus]|nr:CHAT domain-containing protein [Lactifluus subvellereus]
MLQWLRGYQNVLGEFTASPLAENSIMLKNFEGNFKELGKPALEECIAKGEDLISSGPRSHPFRANLLFLLASGKYHIYSNAEIPLPSSYLDGIIVQLGEAIFLASRNDSDGIDISGATSLFASALLLRFDRTRQPSDLENGIACLRRLLRLPLEGTTIQLSGVRERLARALWSRTVSDPASEQENIEELLTQINRTGEMEYLEQLLKPLCEARKICQPQHFPVLSLRLAQLLLKRTTYVGMLDIQEIEALCDESLLHLPSEHPALVAVHSAASDLVSLRLRAGAWDIDTLEHGINSLRAVLSHQPPGYQGAFSDLLSLSSMLTIRHEVFDYENCLREAKLCASKAFDLCEAGTIQLARSNRDTWLGARRWLACWRSSKEIFEERILSDRAEYRQALRAFRLDVTNSLDIHGAADIGGAIRHWQTVLSSASKSHGAVVDMAIVLLDAHDEHGQGDEDLIDNSIDICRNITRRHRRHPSRFHLLRSLGKAMDARGRRTGRSEHLAEAASVFKTAFEERPSCASDGLSTACSWASSARPCGHPSTSLAYQSAMTMVRRFVTAGPTVQAQYSFMGSIGPQIQMPLEYASFQIEKGQVELAIETLEQGRALLWAEMRGLRTFADRLRTLTLPSRKIFGRQSSRRGAPENISQIQTLPGFQTFLKATPFETLRNAASGGPIIIINHCQWRCDIIIILHKAPPSLIPTPSDFYERANILATRLLDTRRNHPLESKQYDRALRWVLEELHKLVGRAVIDKLEELHVAKHQPDANLRGAREEAEVIRAVGIPMTGLFSEKATRAMVMQGLQEHSLVHFACHGHLEPGKPFDASFRLHDGDRLTLFDIVRSRLEQRIADFAFLAACHSAELTDQRAPDEMLHLAAAMQYCGFRSVVGTMWAMADMDGTDLSTCFYGHLFSPIGEEDELTLCERSAGALRDAVREMRKKEGMTLERWVNYVHYGA